MQVIPIGQGPVAGNLVIGEVLMIHVAERMLDDAGKVDPRKLQTIARLGGDWYCHTSDLFTMRRPT
jgi:flavin reductase (DIM6/NTAB) family NADH-FMN oxidoreductase RutF